MYYFKNLLGDWSTPKRNSVLRINCDRTIRASELFRLYYLAAFDKDNGEFIDEHLIRQVFFKMLTGQTGSGYVMFVEFFFDMFLS
jgi:hypothetical protein